jgi:hypothetical protein
MSFDSEEMKKLVDSFEAHFYPVTDPLNPAYTETFRWGDASIQVQPCDWFEFG